MILRASRSGTSFTIWLTSLTTAEYNVDHLLDLVRLQYVDLRRALCGLGEFQLAAPFTHHAMSQIRWNAMTNESRGRWAHWPQRWLSIVDSLPLLDDSCLLSIAFASWSLADHLASLVVGYHSCCGTVGVTLRYPSGLAGLIAADTPVSKQIMPIQPHLDIRQTTTRQPTAVAPSGSGPVSAAATAAARGAPPSSGAAPPQHQLEPWQAPAALTTPATTGLTHNWFSIAYVTSVC